MRVSKTELNARSLPSCTQENSRKTKHGTKSKFFIQFHSPDAALSEELLQQVVRRLHHEHVVQGHEDAANFSEPSHEAELVERAHRLDRLEGVGADHLRQAGKHSGAKQKDGSTLVKSQKSKQHQYVQRLQHCRISH